MVYCDNVKILDVLFYVEFQLLRDSPSPLLKRMCVSYRNIPTS